MTIAIFGFGRGAGREPREEKNWATTLWNPFFGAKDVCYIEKIGIKLRARATLGYCTVRKKCPQVRYVSHVYYAVYILILYR